MLAETIPSPQEPLSSRCARLIPGYNGYETCLIISDAESTMEDIPPLVDTATAQRFAVDLARYALSGNAPFGNVDPNSAHGLELEAFINELAPVDEQAQTEIAPNEAAEVAEKSMLSLLFELHDQSVEEQAALLRELANLSDSDHALDAEFITERSVAFLAINEAAIEKEQEESDVNVEKFINTGTELYAKIMTAQRANIDIILQDKSGAALRIFLLNPDEIDRAGGVREFINQLRQDREEIEDLSPPPDSLLVTYMNSYHKELATRASDLILAVQSDDKSSDLIFFQHQIRVPATAEAALTIEQEESGLSKTDVINRATATYCLCATLQRAGIDIIFEDPGGAVELLEPVWELAT
jgi:hypothetical protein